MTNAKTGQARKPRRRRDERLFVTLTAREKDVIVEAADLEGIGPTEWARMRLLDQATKRLKQAKRANRLLAILAPSEDDSEWKGSGILKGLP